MCAADAPRLREVPRAACRRLLLRVSAFDCTCEAARLLVAAATRCTWMTSAQASGVPPCTTEAQGNRPWACHGCNGCGMTMPCALSLLLFVLIVLSLFLCLCRSCLTCALQSPSLCLFDTPPAARAAVSSGHTHRCPFSVLLALLTLLPFCALYVRRGWRPFSLCSLPFLPGN